MQAPGERLAEARLKAGYDSARSAAIAHNWPESTYQAHENAGLGRSNSRNFGPDDARRYARAFGSNWLWLLYGVSPKAADLVPIAGYVGAGAEVHLVDVGGPGTSLGDVERPPGLDLEHGTAVIVRGDSMLPVFDDGDILYYDRQRRGPELVSLIGLRCIVQVKDGPILVKKLGHRSRKGFTLYSHNAEPRYDQPVEWAAFIEWHRPSMRPRRD